MNWFGEGKFDCYDKVIAVTKAYFEELEQLKFLE